MRTRYFRLSTPMTRTPTTTRDSKLSAAGSAGAVGIVKRFDGPDRLEMLVFQALRDSREDPEGQPPLTAEVGGGGGHWAAALVDKGRSRREVELKLSQSVHRLTYRETFGGCDILIDGRKVGGPVDAALRAPGIIARSRVASLDRSCERRIQPPTTDALR
jgi:hypothetical protein